MNDTDDLILQISNQQNQITELTVERDNLRNINVQLTDQLEQLRTQYDNTQSVISQVTVRQGAFSKRYTRLREMMEDPSKPFSQMTKPELNQFLRDFYDKLSKPVPDDPNEDTV